MKTTIGRNEEVSRKAVVLLARALVVVGFLFWAGGASATPWAVVERGANHNLWQRTTYETTPSGQTISHVHQYIQIETGLNHWQDNQWEPSLAQIDLLPDGTAAATNGQHQAYFPSDIAQGVIKLVTPEGKELQVQPLALSYFDGSNSVLIAELTNSVGELVASNQVLYRGALTGPDGFKVDLRYTYTKASFEQDVIIEDQPPDPASLGLNSNALLQVTTEFFNPPPPEVTQETVPTVVGNLTDDQLSFGVMTMGRGKAFLLGTNATPAGVEKQWFNLSGQQFFVEELPVAAIRNELDALPLTAWRNKTGRALYAVTKGMAMPPRPAAKTTNKTRFLAQATPPRQGFVLDYVAMSSQTNWTFQGNTTYYISGTVNLSGTNTFEGGAVLKYTNGASLNLSFGSVLDWRAASYRPIMFTSKDDNTEGESISGSTGNPTNYYASIALDFIVGAPITLSNVRIAYAQQAVAAYTTPLTLYDVQFLDCSNGLNLSYSSAYLRNALFAGVQNNFNNLSDVTVDSQNTTFASNAFMATVSSGPVTMDLTNCILANVARLPGSGVSLNGSYNGFYNTRPFGTMTNGTSIYPFQAVGAGNYFLTNNCVFLNAGTTNIDPNLLADLAVKTTYPPLVYSNVTWTADTALTPQAPRDTNAPDLGYHYSPIDYLVDTLMITNAVLTVTNGTVVASQNASAGIWLQDGSSITSIGTPLAPNWFVHYTCVQEQPIAIGSGSYSATMLINPYHVSNTVQNGVFKFSKFAMPAGGGSYYFDDYGNWTYQNLLIEDCEFWNDLNQFQGASSILADIKNNLFDRSSISALAPVFGVTNYSLSFSNNLFINTSVTISCGANSNLWTVFDNDFDTCTVRSGFGAVTNGYNAYLNCNGRLNPASANDIVLTNALAYQPGPLGDFYQPTNSPPLHKGSTAAELDGLYDYTVTTNEVIEGTNEVSIGYHYVAMDSSGHPLDTYWIGIPDYLADESGTLGTWLIEYFGHLGVDPNADPDGDGLSNLQEYGLVSRNSGLIPAQEGGRACDTKRFP